MEQFFTCQKSFSHNDKPSLVSSPPSTYMVTLWCYGASLGSFTGSMLISSPQSSVISYQGFHQQWFSACYENFRPRSPKVRSPGPVKWPHLRKKNWMLVNVIATVATPNARSPAPWNFQQLIFVPASNMYILECWYPWPKVRSILWNLDYKPMGGKMKSSSFGRKPFKTFSNIRLQVDLTPWVIILRPVTPRHVAKVISGHERTPAVFWQ